MGKRKYLSDAPDVGVEPDDLEFFRSCAEAFDRPLSDVIDKAVQLGCEQMRMDVGPRVALWKLQRPAGNA